LLPSILPTRAESLSIPSPRKEGIQVGSIGANGRNISGTEDIVAARLSVKFGVPGMQH